MEKYTNSYKHIIYKGEPAYLIEKGNVVSTVSRIPRDHWKTNIGNVLTSDLLKEGRGEKVEYDFEKKYPNGFEENPTEKFYLGEEESSSIDDCSYSDVPDHIDPSTADFDCEGNYCGGVIMEADDD